MEGRDGAEGKEINVFQSRSRERAEKPQALWRTWIIKYTICIRYPSCQTACWIRNHAVIKTLMAHVPGFINEPRWVRSCSDNLISLWLGLARLKWSNSTSDHSFSVRCAFPLVFFYCWISLDHASVHSSYCCALIKLLTCCHLVPYMLTTASASAMDHYII